MRVHFVVHESYEGPGAFDAWINDRGYDASFSRVHLGDSVPATAEGIDLLVVLGGRAAKPRHDPRRVPAL
jgi:GMP synthase (glutamine-hydrolysing)